MDYNKPLSPLFLFLACGGCGRSLLFCCTRVGEKQSLVFLLCCRQLQGLSRHPICRPCANPSPSFLRPTPHTPPSKAGERLFNPHFFVDGLGHVIFFPPPPFLFETFFLLAPRKTVVRNSFELYVALFPVSLFLVRGQHLGSI